MKLQTTSVMRSPLTLAIGIVILSQVAAFFLRNMAAKEGQTMIGPLDTVSEIQSHLEPKDSDLSIIEIAKLNRLNKIICGHKEHHKVTFLELYEYHFASTTLFTICSILAAVFAFLVGQEGWKSSSLLIRYMLITFSALTSFYGLSVKVYKQDTSIQKNLGSYVNYDNLQKQILNFSYTQQTSNEEDKKLDFNQFHSYITAEMIKINNLYLEFDQSAVSNQNYLEQGLSGSK